MIFMKTVQIVWFKRDLRIQDHPALFAAARQGRILPLYILEPELWSQPDMSRRQYEFLGECLHELKQDLAALGQKLILRVGDAVEILAELIQKHSVTAVWSHQETWNAWTYERDKRVKVFLKEAGIEWKEPLQYGVFRRLKDRDGWAAKWYAYMNQTPLLMPSELSGVMGDSEFLPGPEALGLEPDGCFLRQKGGRAEALSLLRGFLWQRGENYTREMSSPVSAFESCSRLSPYLAFGVISVREVFQAAENRRKAAWCGDGAKKGRWPSAMRSFLSRLRWHCHFIQKLEDEPDIEFHNMHSAYDGLRDSDWNSDYFLAWKEGLTGYPMIDACMRCLKATGWINFRMRAMLMSFVSYHLWLHWREPALHLARLFTDYEPGIHFSQAQMQSGTTGINSIRIYNPIKQGIEHDPNGEFIRQWIPELSDMPENCLHTPWLKPEWMGSYPMPIVEEAPARKAAAKKLYGLRKDDSHREEAGRVLRKHASRRPSSRPRKKSLTTARIPLSRLAEAIQEQRKKQLS